MRDPPGVLEVQRRYAIMKRPLGRYGVHQEGPGIQAEDESLPGAHKGSREFGVFVLKTDQPGVALQRDRAAQCHCRAIHRHRRHAGRAPSDRTRHVIHIHGLRPADRRVRFYTLTGARVRHRALQQDPRTQCRGRAQRPDHATVTQTPKVGVWVDDGEPAGQ